MMNQEVATRYARAFFELVREKNSEEQALDELREFAKALQASPQIQEFFNVPTISAPERRAVLEKVFSSFKLTEEVKGLLSKLIEKNRFGLLGEILSAFQAEVDANNGVVRGTVRSAAPLWPEERTRLEQRISKVTGKKAVLDYQEDKSLLGGLLAQVGSYTFDDSLETQLRLIKEDIRRRAN
jgi:F-type H+-transporting ATPase subunit delta